MATLGISLNAAAASLLQTSFRGIFLGEFCPVAPAASVTYGERRMMNIPDVILGPQNSSDTTMRNTWDLTTAEISPLASLSKEFDYSSYNWGLSTEANFQSTNDYDLGMFASVRRHLDYGYHSHYEAPRTRLQDDIIESFLADHPVEKDTNNDQWIIFTAGCMGAGKTYTVRELSKHDVFSFALNSFVSVDPDEIRGKLPEFEVYKEKDPLHAGEFTGKEAGMLAEILTEEALNRGNNVIVDGSLKDAAWYKAYFESLRRKYPKLKLGIIHVTAPLEDILHRVEHRARTTGRRIPMDALMDSLEKVPKSVDELSHHVDFLLEVDNSSGHGLQFPILQGMDGLDFGRRTIAVQRTILLWCFAIQYAERWNAAFNGFFGGSKQPDLENWRASAIR